MSMVTAGQTKKRSFLKSASTGPNHPKKHRRSSSTQSSLPIASARDAIVKELKEHNVLVIVGETASGKTTQIPQFIYNAAGLLSEGKGIAITQPRRVATISLACRVASEMGGKVGKTVGYTVRFEDKTSKETRIKFLTDGMLLREAMSKRNLKKYGVIIVDEAHERTVHTDILFGILKRIQSVRCKTPLKLIIMSATLDADHFSRFFNSAKVLYVQGRQFPITTVYCKTSQKDYAHASLVTALQVHQTKPIGGDILVFLTGQEEIEQGKKLLEECNKGLPAMIPKISVFCLFGALPTSQQVGVFSRPPAGHRKIILSTNIAETSLTIRGVKYVIDCGRVKQKTYNPKIGLESLQVCPISKAQGRQRQGRSGREGPGECYRILTETEWTSLREVEIPEIQRCKLSTVLLNLLSLGIGDVFEFEWIDKPTTQSIQDAVTELKELGAVTGVRELQLTDLGKKMAAFPLSPTFSRVIVNEADIATAVRRRFTDPSSDHVTLIQVYRAAAENNFDPDWCSRHYLNVRSLRTAQNVRKQLKLICKKQGIQLTSSKKWKENIVRSLLYGFAGNVAHRQPDGSYVSVGNRQQGKIHPSSVLSSSNSDVINRDVTARDVIVFNEMVVTTATYLRTCSVMEKSWLQQQQGEGSHVEGGGGDVEG
eukprot:sb/3462841/